MSLHRAEMALVLSLVFGLTFDNEMDQGKVWLAGASLLGSATWLVVAVVRLWRWAQS
jgi:hypothetical protein